MGFGADRAAREVVAIAVVSQHGLVLIAGLVDSRALCAGPFLPRADQERYGALRTAEYLGVGAQRYRVEARRPGAVHFRYRVHMQALREATCHRRRRSRNLKQKLVVGGKRRGKPKSVGENPKA